jgi:hypothetical protein
MKRVPLADTMFEGCVSLERGDGWVRPWRLPFEDRALFMSPEETLLQVARQSSGVRLRFETDSRRIALSCEPPETDPFFDSVAFDLTVEGALLQTVRVGRDATTVAFDALPGGKRVVEIWLPADVDTRLRALEIDDGAEGAAVSDDRPKWVTYGSSLTHCRRAHSPARTWPAIVARRRHWNMTALGYAGQCLLEPMIALMIRDLPADFITLKLGINTIGGGLSPRTYGAAVIGMVRIIREKHPETPITLISPWAFPPHETEPNMVGSTLRGMRRDMEEAHRRLVDRGDKALRYVSGLEMCDGDLIARHAEDQLHPDGDGIEAVAENFLARVSPRRLPREPSPRG